MKTPQATHHLSAWGYVAIYCALAAATFSLPQARLEHLSSNPFQGLVSDLLKAWFLIGTGSLLVYFLLQRNEPVQDGKHPPTLGAVPFLLLATAMLAITGVGLGLTVVHEQQTDAERLHTTADFKLRLLLDLLRQRQADAQFIQATLANPTGKGKDVLASDHDRQWLITSLNHQAQGGYFEAISLFGPGYQRLWTSQGGFDDTPADLRAAMVAARRSNTPQRAGPYPSKPGRLDYVVTAGGMPHPSFSVVLHLDLSRHLERTFPASGQQLPAGDVFLFRGGRDGVQLILPVQELPKQMLDDANSVISRILRQRPPDNSLIAGTNAAGRPGVAAVRHVPDTDWTLAIWQSQDNFYPRLMRDAYWIGFSGILAVFTTAAGLALIRQKARLAEAVETTVAQAERLQALSLLNAIADGSEDAIFAKGHDGRYLLFNRAAARYLGKPADQILGQRDDTLFAPDLVAAMAAHDARVIASEESETTEQTLETAVGRLTFLTTKGPLRDDEGKVIGVFGISRDVTGLKQDAAELRTRNDELERFNRATVGRELDMIALKRKVNALSAELGRKPPFPLEFDAPDDNAPPGGSC